MTTRFKGGPLALIAAGAGLLLVSRKFMQPKRLDLSGQVVLITGSSRGLGLALAEEFARHDARIVLTARDEDELERARLHIAQLGAEVLAIPCDVTKHTEVQSLIDKVTSHYGHIDVLVNNAGNYYRWAFASPDAGRLPRLNEHDILGCLPCNHGCIASDVRTPRWTDREYHLDRW